MATNVKRKKKAEVMSEDGSMTLTGHLKELRNRLIICAVVFVVGVIGFLAVSDKLIDLLTAMARNANYTFVFLAPQEKLMQYFRVSLIAAVVITVPVALYQIYAFAKPGLKRSESFFFKLVLLLGLMLFCIGILFAYKVTLPFMLNFLVTLEGTDYITASISIESYINLCLTMFIIFGCVFEMPLVTIILAKMGIANPEIMKKGRGVAIVLIFHFKSKYYITTSCQFNGISGHSRNIPIISVSSNNSRSRCISSSILRYIQITADVIASLVLEGNVFDGNTAETGLDLG